MLIKRLSKIAAKELRNTRGVAPQWKEKLTLVGEAYGEVEVEKDFLDWIDEIRNNPPEYPISVYLKIVDERFKSTEQSAAQNNPNIVRLSAQAFEVTGRTPSNGDIVGALEKYSADMIHEAFRNYISGLDERELKYATRNFYVYGGLDAIIEVQKKKIAGAVPEEQLTAAMTSSVSERTNEVAEKLAALQKQKEFDEANRDEI